MRPVTVLVLLGVLAAPRPLVPQEPAPARARIIQLTPSLAYLDAGREQGLRVGSRVRVLRNGEVLGQLTVQYLSSHRASCPVDSSRGPFVVGDTVEFTPAAPDPPKLAAPGPVTRSGLGAAGRVRGRLGARLLIVRPPEGGGYRQPVLEARLAGSNVLGLPLGFVTDIRARQSRVTRLDGTVSRIDRNTVYQLAARVGGPQDRAALTVGRQFLPTVASVSLFDGALAEYRTERLGAGLFAGGEPEPGTLALVLEPRAYGGYLQLRSGPGAAARWSATGGAVASYREGIVNREFGFLQVSVITRVLTAFFAEEIDLNRDWKLAAGDPGIAFTSTFLALGLRPKQWLALNGGFDSRRNVRLWRDREDPLTEFDDSFRRGAWGGVTVQPGAHFMLSLDGRSASGTDSIPGTHSVTSTFALRRVGPARLGLRGRVTRYDGGRGTGWLHSGGVSLRPADRYGLELSVGQRRDSPADGSPGRRSHWFGADLDVALLDGWYFLLAASSERGPSAVGDQLYASLSFRF